MVGMTLTSRDVTALRTVMDACRDEISSPGLPVPALRALRELISCDEFAVSGQNWQLRGHFLDQSSTDHGELTGSMVAQRFDGCDNPFWRLFWHLPCSRPERTGDYATVMKISDVMSVRQMRSDPFFRANMIDSGLQREMMTAWPDGAGRSVHLLVRRGLGQDFSERDRFLLLLLRPHLAAAYWTNESRSSGVELTSRQHEILRLVAQGLSNANIARRLTLSEATVRTHLNNIYSRLEVTSRTAAVARAYGAEGCRPEPSPAASMHT